jgi:regulator of protease activity HflC (stomatin/prohibitin superfamily)
MKKSMNSILVGICVSIIFCIIMFNMLLTRISVGEVGVLTQQYGVFGAKKGVVSLDYGAGWHRDFGPLHDWTIFDSTIQTLELTNGKAYPGNFAGPKVALKTDDGYTVQLDLTIKFRIKPGEVHKLYQLLGGSDEYIAMVRNESLKICRDAFGIMKTEGFYNPQIREQQTVEAHQVLGEKLASRHVELVDILIRKIGFDPQYEKKILDKKLADQDVELNKSLALAAEKKGETGVIKAEAEAMVKVIEKEKEGEIIRMQAQTDKKISQIAAEATKYMLENHSTADLYAAELNAKGNLLIKEAEAEGERLKAQALQGEGGMNLVALQAARNLNLDEMTLSTIDLDFLDIEEMIERLGAKKK